MVGACQQNSGIFLVRGGGLEREICGGRGLGRDKMPAGAEAEQAGSKTKLRVYCCEKQDGTGSGAGDQITWAGSGLGAARDRTGCRRKNQLKRKRSIISSSNPGFSKSFSLVMIKLLCSQNPASW